MTTRHIWARNLPDDQVDDPLAVCSRTHCFPGGGMGDEALSDDGIAWNGRNASRSQFRHEQELRTPDLQVLCRCLRRDRCRSGTIAADSSISSAILPESPAKCAAVGNAGGAFPEQARSTATINRMKQGGVAA